MASMLEYLQEMERRKAMGMTPGVPYASKYPSTSTYAPFQNLKKDLGYYKSNVGNIAASSNPVTTKKAGPGRPRLTAEQIQRTASRLGQGTVKALPAFLSGAAKWAGIPGAIYSALESEDLAADQTPESLAISQAWQDANPNWTVPSQDELVPVPEIYAPGTPGATIPSFDVTPDAGGAVGGGWADPPSLYPNQIGIAPPAQPRQELPIENLAFQPNWDTALASTPSGFMPPGAGGSVDFGVPYSRLTVENPYTPEMFSLDQQADVMDKFNKSGMTIEEFNLTQPSYTMGSVNNFRPGPSTVLGKSYHPGDIPAQVAADKAGVVTHLPDSMLTTSSADPADILAAAQVDTFRPVEQLRRTGPSVLPSGVPVEDALPLEDAPPDATLKPQFQHFLEETSSPFLPSSDYLLAGDPGVSGNGTKTDAQELLDNMALEYGWRDADTMQKYWGDSNQPYANILPIDFKSYSNEALRQDPSLSQPMTMFQYDQAVGDIYDDQVAMGALQQNPQIQPTPEYMRDLAAIEQRKQDLTARLPEALAQQEYMEDTQTDEFRYLPDFETILARQEATKKQYEVPTNQDVYIPAATPLAKQEEQRVLANLAERQALPEKIAAQAEYHRLTERANLDAMRAQEEAERQAALAKAVYADLMANRDRGGVSDREMAAAMERATQVDTFSEAGGDRGMGNLGGEQGMWT